MNWRERRHEEFETAVRAVEGRRIVSVRYVDLPLCAAPTWEGDVHTVAFGVELGSGDGAWYSVTWGGEFVQWGISLPGTRLRAQLIDSSSALECDVSAHPQWSPLIGATVRHAKVYWSWVAPMPSHEDARALGITWDELRRRLAAGTYVGERTYYPQDIELAFDNGRTVYLSAVSYQPGSDSVMWSDDVSVIFGDDAARRYRVGPYAEDA